MIKDSAKKHAVKLHPENERQFVALQRAKLEREAQDRKEKHEAYISYMQKNLESMDAAIEYQDAVMEQQQRQTAILERIAAALEALKP